jgi:DNA-binding Lrp family transcriptional regulator
MQETQPSAPGQGAARSPRGEHSAILFRGGAGHTFEGFDPPAPAYGACRAPHAESSVPARLDALDWKILEELQNDGRMTNVELAHRIGISPPPCLRRVRALEEAGYIRGYRALLNAKQLGYEVTVFAMVHLVSQAEADLVAFETFVHTQPLVRECWMLSGEIDFILKCVAPDLRTLQTFIAELTAAPHVRNVKTSLTLKTSKDAPAVPLEIASIGSQPAR